MLKMLPRKGKAYLLNALNAATRLGYFPQVWKHAVVVPLLKPAKKGDVAEHYRPISLLSHISKVYERLLQGHVMSHCRKYNIIPPEQTGFMPGVSCDHHIARLQSHVSQQFNKNAATAFISLDCTQAFDCVSHSLLMQRLEEHRFPSQLVAVLRAYLSGRTFAVRVGNDVSEPRSTNIGVPQGSVLGPILFIIYTAQVIEQKYETASVAAYADDIGVYASSINAEKALLKTQKACDDIVTSLEDIGIHVNPAKTDALVMSFQGNKGSRKHGGLPDVFHINGKQQKISTRINYLGVKLERHLSVTPHVDHRLKLARQKSYRLSHLLRTPNISLRLKLLMYKAIIRPTLMHGAVSMRYMFHSTLQKMQRFQNGVILKMVRNTSLQGKHPTELHEEFNLPTVTEFIRRRHIKFFDGLQHCVNPLFRDVSPPTLPKRWQTRDTPLMDLVTV